jgi:hypothetical protein
VAISLVSTPTNATGSSTSVVISVPSSVANGDLLLAEVSWGGGTGVTVTPPAGWTLVRRDDSTTVFGMATYKRLAAAEPANYTWTLSPSSSFSATMIAYRGVDLVNPIDTHSGQANASSTSVSAPTLTTTYANEQLVFYGQVGAVATFTPPGSFAEQSDINFGEIADQLFATPGATGTITATASSAGLNIGQLVALKPLIPSLSILGI